MIKVIFLSDNEKGTVMMDEAEELVANLFLGNAWWQVGALFLSILLFLLAGKLARVILSRVAGRMDREKRVLTAVAFRSVSRVVLFAMVVVGIRVGIAFLTLSPGVSELAQTLISVMITVAIGLTLYHLTDVIHVALTRYTARTESSMDDMIVPIARTSLHITIIILTVLQVAQTLTGKPLTSIIAGLGVGGLAVALAAQDTIKHFFGSLVLFADKPFQIGERIVVDTFDGTVEQVGFRSTRIRTLDGHLVTVPNGDLANKMIQNIGQRPHIRRLFTISVTYDTPPAKVQRAVEILRELLDQHEGMDPAFPPQVYFKDFAAFSLDILVIYWYHPPAYWDYLAFSEKLNQQILERFNAEGIEFAFPTQTLHLAGSDGSPLRGPDSSGPSASPRPDS